MSMIRILPLACLLLAACSPQPSAPVEQPAQTPTPTPTPAPVEPDAAPAPAAVAAPADGATGRRLRVTGTEPFWAVDVDGSRLLYMTPDNPDGTVLTASETPFARGSSWTGSHAGQPFSLTVREDGAGACSDGMSDREYRYHADFDIGRQQLHGCGEDVAVLERQMP